MGTTTFQGVSIPNPESPNGPGQYKQAPPPINFGHTIILGPWGKQDYINLFVHRMKQNKSVTCNPETGQPESGNRLGMFEANVDYGVCRAFWDNGEFAKLQKFFGQGNYTKPVQVSGTMQWVQAHLPMETSSGPGSFSETQTMGVTNSKTITNTFAESIGLSVGATYEAITATISAKFTSTSSKAVSISVDKGSTSSTEISVPKETTAQFWQLMCTFTNKAQGISLTVGGPYLALNYPATSEITMTVN